jgi:hypothetical protein
VFDRRGDGLAVSFRGLGGSSAVAWPADVVDFAFLAIEQRGIETILPTSIARASG